jgi:hypothetical protein
LLTKATTDSKKHLSPSAKKKQSKVWQQQSVLIPQPLPRLSMSDDLLCAHGGLALAAGLAPSSAAGGSGGSACSTYVVSRNPAESSSTAASNKAKRRLISSKMWRFLRKFFPYGPEFKCIDSVECCICLTGNFEAIETAAWEKEAKVILRKTELVPDVLTSLSMRKCGVPIHCLTSRVALFNELEEEAERLDAETRRKAAAAADEWQLYEAFGEGQYMRTTDPTIALPPDLTSSAVRTTKTPPAIPVETELYSTTSAGTSDEMSTGAWESTDAYTTPALSSSSAAASFVSHNDNDNDNDNNEALFGYQPLVPGLYNLVPKKWLQAWRRYTKDIKAPKLPHLDCTALICDTHGLLIVPPHVEGYLCGLQRTLLNGLGGYSGEIAEIISADEWDELQNVFHGAADFNVRFCLDGSNVMWNIGVCARCDPFFYQSVEKRNSKKASQNSQSMPGLVV